MVLQLRLIVVLIAFLPVLDVILVVLIIRISLKLLAFSLLQLVDVLVDICVVVKALPEASQPQQSSLLAVLNCVLACSEHNHQLLDAQFAQKVAVDGLSDGPSIHLRDFRLDVDLRVDVLGGSHSATTVSERPSSHASTAAPATATSSVGIGRTIRVIVGFDIVLSIDFPLHIAGEAQDLLEKQKLPGLKILFGDLVLAVHGIPILVHDRSHPVWHARLFVVVFAITEVHV